MEHPIEIYPYLVQRASFCHDSYREGIDSILSFHYMGSSEFERGALPDSLKRIRKNKSDYVITELEMNGKSILAYCKRDIGIDEYLSLLAKGHRTKEANRFQEFVDDKEDSFIKTDFWWDIENDIMFWRSDDEFNFRFRQKI
jgi:hypothetical protein